MAFTIQRIGSATGGTATEYAITHHPGAGPAILTVRRAGSMTHSFWDLLPDGALFESEVQTKPSGTHLALAAYDGERTISIHRPTGGKLNVEVYRTGGSFSFERSKEFEADSAPSIVPYGADGPPLDPSPLPLLKPAPSPANTETSPSASRPGTVLKTKLPKKVKAATELSASLTVKFGRAVVGSLTSAGQLRLSSWTFDGGGDVRVLVGVGVTTLAGAAQSYSLRKVRENWEDGQLRGVDLLATLRNAAGKLVLQRWRLTLGSPSTFAKLSEVNAPESVTAVSSCAVEATGPPRLVTAVRLASQGTLRVTAWRMEANGGITRLASADGPAVDLLSTEAVRGRTFVTVMRQADGTFRASYWKLASDADAPIEAMGSVTGEAIESRPRCAHVPGTGTHLGDTIVAVRLEGQPGLRMWRYQVTE